MIQRLLLSLFAAVMLALPAHAQTFPQLAGKPVVDQANIIPNDREAALDAKLLAIQQETGRQVAVATIANLEGYDIADYGYRLGRAWGIGEKGKNNGLIVIVAPSERRMRIEVGYGLEPIVTDGLSSQIINDQMKPAFKAGDFAGGIDAAVGTLAVQLKLPPEEAAARAKLASAPQDSGISIGTIIFLLFIFFFFVLPILRAVFGRRRGIRHSSGPVIIWGGGDSFGGPSSSWGGGGSSWGGGGGFSGGGGSFGGGGSSGSW